MKILMIIIAVILLVSIQVYASEIEYSGGNFRDPFKSYLPESNLLRPTSSTVKGLSQLQLSGIMWGEGMPLAIINGKVYKIGDAILGTKIIEINKQGVLLKYREESFILKPK
ncbi:MAG: hypothetical protein P9X27_00345 [Candidatus Kaelpia aquatica]|nr:hypothetical protein [Candidatus Kaelpia aquatica]